MASLARTLFSISSEETTFGRRGFQGHDAGVRQRLERVGSVFVLGYHAALEIEQPEHLALRLDTVDREFRGFAFEGAAMGLTLLDRISLRRRDRVRALLEGVGAPHAYMIHVGCGWAFARLHRHPEHASRKLDPLLRWLAVDGYGFHEGYFRFRRYAGGRPAPRWLSTYGRRVFDQGLGRSLWFVNGADVVSIGAEIGSFSPSRRADLWSGVGLACAYAGGLDPAELEALWAAATPHGLHLAQGAAFAAKARQRAGNPAPQTELACDAFCGVSAETAAALTDDALDNLRRHGEEPAYEVWRRQLRVRLAGKAVAR